MVVQGLNTPTVFGRILILFRVFFIRTFLVYSNHWLTQGGSYARPPLRNNRMSVSAIICQKSFSRKSKFFRLEEIVECDRRLQ